MIKKYIRYVIIILFVCISGLVYSCERSSEGAVISAGEEESTQTTADETDSVDMSDCGKKICVHVSGYVMNPGVYMLPEGSRVYEAVAAAGGFAEGADEQFLNLAKVLDDGQKIRIYSLDETATASGDSDLVQKDSNDTEKLININTATKESLMTLPGIGESRAESIIAYREQNGYFSSVEDIMKVSGIKEAAFEKIKDYICIK